MYHGLQDPVHGLIVWVTERESSSAPADTYELERRGVGQRYIGKEKDWTSNNLSYSILYNFLGYPPRIEIMERFAKEMLPKEDGSWELHDKDIAHWLAGNHELAFGE